MKLIRFLLFPIAVIYDIVTRVRNFLFDVELLKSKPYDIPVIAVGNLSVGGTGKTPQIEYLIELLKNDYKIAVLSRGYKRKTKGFIILNDYHTAKDVGDEPLQFFKKFPQITVAVDADRVNGINKILEIDKPDVVLLDDAYQHRKVKAGFYILLTKYSELFIDDFLLPTGNLRESSIGVKRTDCIIVTKCPMNMSMADKQKIKSKVNKISNQPVFFTSINYDENLYGSEKLSVNDLINKNSDLIAILKKSNDTIELTFPKSIKKVTFRKVGNPSLDKQIF